MNPEIKSLVSVLWPLYVLVNVYSLWACVCIIFNIIKNNRYKYYTFLAISDCVDVCLYLPHISKLTVGLIIVWSIAAINSYIKELDKNDECIES